MTRVPLRPLARILDARAHGADPNEIERENKRLRHEEMRDQARLRAEGRLLVLAAMFFCAFVTVGVRMGTLAGSEPSEPRVAASTSGHVATRADIVDRQGRLMATNLVTHALYAQPHQMVDPAGAAAGLIKIFPDLDEADLLRRFTNGTKFLWIKRKISPEQMQAVHDIGEPGLLFGEREMRLYPNGPVAAHVMGGARFDKEGVSYAELLGVAGIEAAFEERLSDPARAAEPLMLTLDLTVQSAVEEVLAGGMQLMNAKGAAAIVMEAHTGEVVALASLPDFDPNDRPAPAVSGDPSDNPLFNRAVQGVYELGSTFKVFAAAQALEMGIMTPETMVDTTGPIKWGPHKINDYHNYGAELSLANVIVQSSNLGTARIAQAIGTANQRAFLDRLGFTKPTAIELSEATRVRPLTPDNWSELSTMTISYGHGISASPMHLAAAYASLLNGGTRVTPTLVRTGPTAPGPRIISEETSATVRAILRQVVSEERGTANYAEVPGYAVAGKTGTADKPRPTGGYYEGKVIATFAGVFPAHDPRYIIIVTLDEPEVFMAGENRRSAGYTAVPVAAEVIRRAAPLLGLRPEIEPEGPLGVTLTSN